MRAEIARPDELDVRRFDGDVRCHRTFGNEHHLTWLLVLHPLDHARSRTREVRRGDDVGAALGMRDDLEAGLVGAHTLQFFAREALMHLARAFPCDDFDFRLRLHPLRQILVWYAQNAWRAEAFHNFHGIGRGAGDIAFGFHRRRRVHIGDDRHTRISLAKASERLRA